MSIYPIACCAVLYKTRQHKAALYVNQTSWHMSRWHQLQSAVTSTVLSCASASSSVSELQIWRTWLLGSTTQVGGLDMRFVLWFTALYMSGTKLKHLAERVLYLPVCKTILSRKLYLQWTFFGTERQWCTSDRKISLNPEKILAKNS